MPLVVCHERNATELVAARTLLGAAGRRSGAAAASAGAAAGRPDRPSPLAAVASLAAPTVAIVVAALGEGAKAGLNSALDADVLRIEEGRLCFAHPLLCVAALTRLVLQG